MLDTAVIKTEMSFSSGDPYPLGATVEDDGINFAVFSQNAKRIDLCLFQSLDDTTPIVIEMPGCTNNVWHIKVSGLVPGQLYGFIADGDYNLAEGHRFNPHKILLDPYAKSIARPVNHDSSLYGYQLDSQDDSTFCRNTNIEHAPLARAVKDDEFEWGDESKLRHSMTELVIYETHVKGFSYLNENLPEDIRGTYLGLAHSNSIDYLKNLGVNAVELMPVQSFLDDSFLVDKGLSNYWGYNTLGFFAPEPRYASPGSSERGSEINQFKTMVKALHEAGIEVILDVVYNHTCEGNEQGPTLSFRGLDNASYYRLADDKRYYYCTTGCGNMFNFDHPAVLQLLMDSLRYWVTEMHVDGFRFDLASSLAREKGYFDNNSALFKAISQDPVLSTVKLIAEPWDIENDGYQVGNFPGGWAEWNGRFRDSVRSYWKGDSASMATFATCFSGNSHLYSHKDPYSSINFVTCHDGFTLYDLVSYNDKHNDANKEGGNDGESHNLSWNCGEEGPTQNSEVNALRDKQVKNFLATLGLSFGVPMFCYGDEQKRTQKGNNNTYCQDNELTWLSWSNEGQGPFSETYSFVRKVLELRRQNSVYRKDFFFSSSESVEESEMTWFNPDGSKILPAHCENPEHKTCACYINADVVMTNTPSLEEFGKAKSLIYVFNSHFEDIDYKLPESLSARQWDVVLNTDDTSSSAEVQKAEGASVVVKARSLVVLQQSS
jgi:isoamylase